MTLGQHIQDLRVTAGLSQEALSKQLRISHRTLSKWESDEAAPDLNRLVTMSELFGVSIGSLLDIEGFDAPPIPEEMTAQEWKTIESILANPKKASRRYRTLSLILMLGFLLIITLFLIWFFGR